MSLDLALVHHPVVNRIGETIASTVDELDVFDACRLCRVYPVRHLWIVTPVPSQRALVDRLLRHGRAPQRESEGRQRFEAVTGVDSVADAVARAAEAIADRPQTWSTSAQPPTDRAPLTIGQARALLAERRPAMLLIGKAWGLAPEILTGCDAQLEPLQGGTGNDHYPVRGAMAVLLDRLLAPR